MNFSAKKVIVCRLCAIICGGALPFSFAPFNLYFIPVISLSALFYLWTTARNSKETFIIGYLFGFAMFGLGVNWLHISINLFGGVNLIGALFFTYALIAFISIYPALCGYFLKRFFRSTIFISTAPLWLLTEWARGWILTGFPWLNLGTSQTDSIFSGFVPVIGDYGLSFILCLVSISIMYLFTGNKLERIISLLLLVLTVICALALKNSDWTEPIDEINVVLVQGAIPQEHKWRPESRGETYTRYTGLSKPFWSSDLIIWPETAIPSFYHLANDFIDPIDEQKQKSNAIFMSGIAYQDKTSKKYYNSIVLIDDTHRFYHKHHLVPFGEYLPLEPLLGNVLQFLEIPLSGFSPGRFESKIFETSKGILGMSICYEDAYGSEIRRSLPEANVLINVSNDAWFGDSLAPHQHLQIARMRALENGRFLLRATNTGISAIINNKGGIVVQSPRFTPHALQADIKLFRGTTPFSSYGNGIVLALSLSLLLIGYLRQRKGNDTASYL